MSGPFVGHHDALRAVATAIEAAGSGDGRVVVVSGEPGIGKTRLVAEAVCGHEARWANCWQGDGAPAFWPWRQLLATTSGLFAASDEPDARFALFDAVAEALASATARELRWCWSSTTCSGRTPAPSGCWSSSLATFAAESWS